MQATVRRPDEPPVTTVQHVHGEFIEGAPDCAQMRVLVVEDEPRMASVIRRSLAKQGLAADVTQSGEDSLWMAEAVAYDAIVLDVMLPDRSGFDVCRTLRERGVWSPVLMLTAR